MQPNSDISIAWFPNHKGATYSMLSRRGPDSFDCSSAQYFSLIDGGYFPSNIYIGNTDSLFNDLEKYGWTQLKPNAQGNFDTQRNDIFIWGKRGASGGGDGHTGRFIDENNVEHWSAYYNGYHVNNYDGLHAANGMVEATYYRFTGLPAPVTPNNPTDQIVEVGSFIKFNSLFRVDDVQKIADVWQVKTDVLCPYNFTWADNGIPAAPLVEVGADGFATPDQTLEVGSHYVIPGIFKVLEVGQSYNRWLAKIGWGTMTFWVDLEPATEVTSDDPGTPTPIVRPIPVTTTTTEVPHVTETTTQVPTVTTSTTAGTTTASTTIAPEPTTTTPTTTVAQPSTPYFDPETDVRSVEVQNWLWTIIKAIAITIFNRLRGVQ